MELSPKNREKGIEMATKAYQTAGGSGNIKSSMKMAMLAATQAIANDTYNKVPLTNAYSLMPFLLLNILFERNTNSFTPI